MRKKFTQLALALALCLGPAAPAMAQYAASADENLYDLSGFNADNLMTIFKAAADAGRNYPTDAEFAAAGIQKSDIAFMRSHVRKRAIMSRADRLISNTYENRQLMMNIPMNYGKDIATGQPSNVFHSDVFSMWQYTNVFGNWNHGFFQCPSVWGDAAHKNGTDIMSGIMFFESWGTGAGGWASRCPEKNTDGTYKWVKPIINILMYFGMDGINYNWEDSGYNSTDVVGFHQALYEEAAARGFDNFHIVIYTAQQSLTAANVSGLFGSNGKKTADAFLNYNNGDFYYSRMGTSATAAMNALGTTDGVYQGVWIVNMNRSWTGLNNSENAKKIGLCLWGEHSSSRFWSYNSGSDAYDTQSNYQKLLERTFSGGNRNPVYRPAISNSGNNWEAEGTTPAMAGFAGLCSWIPERTTITGNLPFATGFQLGNGDRYTYKGKRTTGAWYNMGAQDIVPTYRWLVVNAGSNDTYAANITPEFTHNDSYTGGSCLQVTGNLASGGTDLILYKTSLTVSAGNPYAKVAVKNLKEGTNASGLYVIVRKSDGTWVETPYGNVSGSTWEEKQINITGLSTGDVIDRIGLRFKGSESNYKIYVGKLEINDAVTATPAAPKDVNVEVKCETKSSLSARIYWDVDGTASTRASWGLLYNDEANIDHFEVMYKNGAEGRVSEVARTTSWGTLVGDIFFDSADDEPYIGVRSVSTDLKTYSPVQWVRVERAAQSELPDYVAKSSYGVSEMDPSCDGVDNARVQRYLETVTTTGATQNLNYTGTGCPADGTQYQDATDNVLEVAQGQTVNIFIKAHNTISPAGDYVNGTLQHDGLRYCLGKAWIDFDGNGVFHPDFLTDNPSKGECILQRGTLRAGVNAIESDGETFTFTVPTDAKPGESMLRMVFNDAWFAGSLQPSGYHNKGFSIDFGVKITGTNPARQPDADLHDQGQAEEPEGLNPSGVDKVVAGGVASFTKEDGALHFTNVDKAWIYTAAGQLVKYVAKAGTVSLGDLDGGVYLVKMQSGNVIRSAKFVK